MTDRTSRTGGIPEVGSTRKLTTLADKLNSLPEPRRNAIEERAQVLISEEMSLQALRKARKFTQATIAEGLGVNQENISRLERREDSLISSLRNYVEAMGGELHLVADFPDREPVELTSFTALEDNLPDPTINAPWSVELRNDVAASEGEGISAAHPMSGWHTGIDIVGDLKMGRDLDFSVGNSSDPDAYKKFIEQAAVAFCTYLSDSSDYPLDQALSFLEREKDKEDVEQAVGRIMSIMARSAIVGVVGDEEESEIDLSRMKLAE